VLGVICERPKSGLAPKRTRWESSLGYRYLPSYRHFVGTVEQVQRERLGTQIRNDVHIWDLALSYQLNNRWTVNATIPFMQAWRGQLYNPRGTFSHFAQGDATVGARVWLFRPPTESRRNVAIGMAAKLPTGRYNLMGDAIDARGNRIRATADQSIQPGDGRLGFVMDVNAYTPTYFRSWLYFQGTYLFNPANTNGVSTFRTRPGEQVFSVTDQYLYRGGISRAIPRLRGWAASFGARMEGVPVRDVFGADDGFRRPGYAFSIDPGIMHGRGNWTFSLNAPVAMVRNRKRSVSDIRNGTHGDAAFADYSFIFGLSKRF
jgi:hypothetical protein